MSPTAVADLKGTLSLSVYFETTRRLLNDAIDNRDQAVLRHVNTRMQDDKFDDLPLESQRELTFLFARAITVTKGWGAP